jgi:hypothetical protein
MGGVNFLLLPLKTTAYDKRKIYIDLLFLCEQISDEYCNTAMQVMVA